MRGWNVFRRNCLKVNCYRQYSPKVFIGGANGQIGTELVPFLRGKYGKENVIASDVRAPGKEIEDGPFEYLDMLDKKRLEEIVRDYDVDWIIHNGALLSAVAEKQLDLAQRLNTEGLHNVLGLARDLKSNGKSVKVFVPSSIAAFGPTTPLDNTPDYTIQRPSSVYGVGKVYAELMGEYYYRKFGVDFRSLRYPGIISWKALPGGGTTDAFVDVFYHALKGEPYECYLKEDEHLPMMYMDDCVKATVEIMEANTDQLGSTRVYNVSAFSLTMRELTSAIQKVIPDLKVTYNPDDLRQPFAASWPNSLDDTLARKNWNWQEDFTVDRMVEDMVLNLGRKLREENPPMVK